VLPRCARRSIEDRVEAAIALLDAQPVAINPGRHALERGRIKVHRTALGIARPCHEAVKRELAWTHQRTTWTTRASLRTALFDYIEGFYNPERIQQRLDNRSPIDFEHHAVA
jgi:transposase InsO family protein